MARKKARKRKRKVHKKKKRIYGFDTEFLLSEGVGHKGDISTVQFSDGVEPLRLPYPIDPANRHTVVLESAGATKKWIRSHRMSLKDNCYAFVALCDVGSLQEWLGKDAVYVFKKGVQIRAVVKYGGAAFKIFDAAPLLKSFGFRRLADCGEMLGIPKMVRPSWLGKRQPKNSSERKYFLEYSARDAVITSLIVRWLIDAYGADPSYISSAGTLASKIFKFPKRLKRVKNTVMIKPFEEYVRNNTFAGRSEGFTTGFIPNIFYNDISSLYPCSMLGMRALMVDSYERCKFESLEITRDLSITESEDVRYGWVEGCFRSTDKYWSLPVRGKRVTYMIGDAIHGLFNTFDLAASHVQVLNVTRCWKPTYRKSMMSHTKFCKMLQSRLRKDCSKVDGRYIKSTLNASSGKLGQHRFVSETSNFLSYNLLLGHSHLLMSLLFNECLKLGSKPIAMDTDSIFCDRNLSGEWFQVCDCYGNYVPINVTVKGVDMDDKVSAGDLAFFRSKRYILWDKNRPYKLYKNPCLGRMGWNYFVEDFVKLHDGTVTELHTRKDLRHTLATREIAAKDLILGHWRVNPAHLKLEDLRRLMTADLKRKRTDYDSYQLVMDKKCVSSQPWNVDDYFDDEKDFLGLYKKK